MSVNGNGVCNEPLLKRNKLNAHKIISHENEINNNSRILYKNGNPNYHFHSLKEHYQNVKQGIAFEDWLTPEHIYNFFTKPAREREEAEDKLHKAALADELYNSGSEGGEIKFLTHVDWFTFKQFIQTNMTPTMFILWSYFDNLKAQGILLKVSVRELAEDLGIGPDAVNKSLIKLCKARETCPICHEEGFKLLDKIGFYEFKKEECDTYDIQSGIEYLCHLRKHVKQFQLSEGSKSKGWELFRIKAKDFIQKSSVS